MKTIPPNQYRETGEHMGMWNSTSEDGMNGAFCIPLKSLGHKGVGCLACCIVSDGRDAPEPYGGWEHVSVYIKERDGREMTPRWDEMCMVKDLFWDPEEVVVQFHPAKSQYVNNHPHVLHLWKWTNGEFPTPSSLLVGIKSLGNLGAG